jgi:hypothetical protein
MEFLLISFKIQLLKTVPQKQKEQRQKQLDSDKLVTTQIWKLINFCCLFFLMSFPFLDIMNSLQYLLERDLRECVREETAHLATLKLKIIYLTRLQRLKQEERKRPPGIRQTDGKNLVWFGEIERKLAQLSKTTFTYCSSS